MHLSRSLNGVVPERLLSIIPHRYEVIGDIAVVNLPDALLPFQTDIARSIIAGRKNISTVLRRVSKREGENRVARYEPIIGSKTTTTCRESGFSYRVDLSHAFFTTRLAGERQRVAAMVQPGEKIFIPFAGVGPFVIPIGAWGSEVVALEMNPAACRLLSENLSLNHIRRTAVVRGDARYADRLLRCRFDRAIIPTPYGLDEAFGPVARVVKSGGYIHFYTFKNRKQAEDLVHTFQKAGFVVLRYHRCGNVAPSVSRWVFDLKKGE